MSLRHEIYRGPGDRPASRFVCDCGDEFEPVVVLALDSSHRGIPNPYGGPRYYQPPAEHYTPYRKLLAWLERHRACVGRREVWTGERGVEVGERRGKR